MNRPKYLPWLLLLASGTLFFLPLGARASDNLESVVSATAVPPCVIAPELATLDGVIAPRPTLTAGVLVPVATLHVTPCEPEQLTLVTVPDPPPPLPV